MLVKEVLVVKKPATAIGKGRKNESVWTRKAALRAIWQLRIRIMLEQGIDIFQVYEMSDCIEVHIEGDFKGKEVDARWIKRREGIERRAREKKINKNQ